MPHRRGDDRESEMNETTKHTKGMLVKDYGCTLDHIKAVADGGRHGTPTLFRYDEQFVGLQARHQRHANARRLVACWNACEGISTETIENLGDGSFKAHIDAALDTTGDVRQVTAERAALLRDKAELVGALVVAEAAMRDGGCGQIAEGETPLDIVQNTIARHGATK